MFLTKKSKSMFNMIKDDSIEKSDEKINSAPIVLKQRHDESDVSLKGNDDDEEEDHKSQIFKLNESEEKILQNATDDEKKEINKEWDKLHDERVDDDGDVVMIKTVDKKFRSTSDIFSFRDCGEPQKEQFLSLDFSPEEGVDDDNFVLNKCINFWQFIEKHPDLQSLRAEPENLEYEEDTFVSRTPSPISTKSTFGLDLSTCPSSISVLASTWLKKEDLMSSSLATKTEAPCKPESYEYADYQIDKPIKPVTKKKLDVHASKSHLRSATSNLSVKGSHPNAYIPVDDMSKMMDDMRKFDIKHRDYKDPPGHSPSLIHAQMIRNEGILPYMKTGRG